MSEKLDSKPNTFVVGVHYPHSLDAKQACELLGKDIAKLHATTDRTLTFDSFLTQKQVEKRMKPIKDAYVEMPTGTFKLLGNSSHTPLAEATRSGRHPTATKKAATQETLPTR